MFYRLQRGKEEAFALYGAVFMLCSFCTTFLLLAILSPINPERAPRERLRGLMVTGSEQQAPGCCAGAWGTGSRRLLCIRVWEAGTGGLLGWGVLGGQGIPSQRVPPGHICIAILLLPCSTAWRAARAGSGRLSSTSNTAYGCLEEGTGCPSLEKGEREFVGRMWRPGLAPPATPSPTIYSWAPF